MQHAYNQFWASYLKYMLLIEQVIAWPWKACSLDSQAVSCSVRLWLPCSTGLQPQWPQIPNKMVPSGKHTSKCQKPPGWHQIRHAGFSTVYGLCTQSNFIYRLSGLCICWAKHSSVSEPLAFLGRVQGRLQLGATEQQKASVPVHMLRPLLLSGIMIARWDVNRS